MLKTLKKIDYHKEQIELLFRAKGGIIASSLLVPLLTILILQDFVPMYILLILTFMQIIVFIIRMVFTNRLLKLLDGLDNKSINSRLKIYLVLIFINSFLLGIVGIFSVLYAEDIYILFLITVYVVVSAGSLSTLGSVYHAVFIFTFVVLSIFIIALIFIGSAPIYYFVAILLVIYMLITIPSALKIYNSISSNIRQREELKEKTELLIQQSRQAAMGEMIGNIAHQWRQPLNALGLVLQNINFEYQMETLNDDFMDKSIKKGDRLVKTMSKTIDDFRNFFEPNKVKEKFKIATAIQNTLNLVEDSFINYDIKIKTDLDENIEFNGYPSEFSQVILNILSNSKDALIENKIEKKEVKISTYQKENSILIEIFDNADGIAKGVIEKVFEPYFTTKGQGKGTGIGLYMSKTIIETNMNGKISVKNGEDGANFIIKLPI